MKKGKRRLSAPLIAAGATAVALASVAIPNAYVIGSTHSRMFPRDLKGLALEMYEHGKFDCIMVLGARVYQNGNCSKMLARRLDVAIADYHAGASSTLVMSGSNTEDSNWETDRMRDYALRRGIPKEAITCDERGFDTYSSMEFAKRNWPGGRILIASQPFHLPRAIMCARSMGLDACGVEAGYGKLRHRVKSNAREVLARPKDLAKTSFKK